jgi:solute carrier family 50 protein (sugar transporter)
MLFNCLGWVTYAILIDNLFVFFGNIFALCLAVWFNMIALELQYAAVQSQDIRRSIARAIQSSTRSIHINQQEAPTAGEAGHIANPFDLAKVVWDVAALNTKAPVTHKTIIMVLTVIWTAVLCTIALGRSFPASTKELIVGVVVNVNLMFFYGAPLSTIMTVVRTRSSSTIHRRTMITNTLNGIFWGAFGLAVMDFFIAVPNLLGAILGAVQMMLCVVFKQNSQDLEPSTEQKDAFDLDEELRLVVDDKERDVELAKDNSDVELTKDDSSTVPSSASAKVDATSQF